MIAELPIPNSDRPYEIKAFEKINDDGSFEEIVEKEYALIFVQRLSKLQESANKLKKLGYYDKYYKEYNVEDIYEQRENYYRRLKWQ